MALCCALFAQPALAQEAAPATTADEQAAPEAAPAENGPLVGDAGALVPVYVDEAAEDLGGDVATAAADFSIADTLMGLVQDSGLYALFQGNWKNAVMIGISCVLLYLAIVKKFEPLLLMPIAFGMLLTNLPLGRHLRRAADRDPRQRGIPWQGGCADLQRRYAHRLSVRQADRRSALLPVSGRQAGHLSAAHLPGRGRDDRLRPADCQSQEPAAGRRRAAGHLRDVYDRAAGRLYARRGQLHRHHRRRGRTDRAVCDHQAGAEPAGPDRRGPRIRTWRWCLSSSRRS